MTSHREVSAMSNHATPEQLQARLDLRRSNAAQPHRNRKREMKRPGKGHRKAWKRDEA
ncbi:hypothetical protein SEA_LITTLEGUY_82 [Mycobacterium phage LittleGuy]|uniref:Uncharacterized protein n=4 Tax=Backyardiganvirus peaches TaxID=663557 RepID=W0LNK8_9CAUD|nr:hypothetical protein PEACHES_80 [Mycobacterium phage Peaches]YP_009005920.1 hypothetical protein PBI_NYXIS_81 [Mycobacterium phage Nyxis]AOT27502.1 hypothetical protein SEA_LITTLEGUY_82 [Mycobacterium phage LittleGuy]QAY10604.1 hypothetical protein SEA_PHONTBONNE_82 [Mycobacterium phage Phontbonne]URP22478.1 hypothetical protein SEA_TAQUARUS_81 [Mycobacterium phage Taquarus]ACU41831.1 hypothetical protein PEACHES_80 [Mycobacterium phage Peaches]AHG24126.1 hypothetical protein PBI_NYXIS_81 